ncbi:MAG: hypothetical protein PHN56_05760 [Candidatus Nanoarchaeia archaeon]|nr:hypothetical protein [Candidatus Nanoarchaeia archaeon]
MHNQLEHFREKLEKICLNSSEYYIFRLKNIDEKLTYCKDFLINYHELSSFEKRVAKNLPNFDHKSYEYLFILNKDLKICYINNSEFAFTQIQKNSINILNPQDYLISRITEKKQDDIKTIPITSFEEYNLKDYFVNNLKKKLITQGYYPIHTEINNNFISEISSFYGKQGTNKCLELCKENEENYGTFFDSDIFPNTLLVNPETLIIEQSFNSKFIKYDTCSNKYSAISLENAIKNYSETVNFRNSSFGDFDGEDYNE